MNTLEKQSSSNPTVQSGAASRADRSQRMTPYKAWVAKAAKQPMVLETVDLGPLGAEEVEVAVQHCGGFCVTRIFPS